MPATATITGSTPSATPSRTSSASGTGAGFASALSDALGDIRGAASLASRASAGSVPTQGTDTGTNAPGALAASDPATTETPAGIVDAAARSATRPEASQDAPAPQNTPDAVTAATATPVLLPMPAQEGMAAATPATAQDTAPASRNGGATRAHNKSKGDADGEDEAQSQTAGAVAAAPDPTLAALSVPIPPATTTPLPAAKGAGDTVTGGKEPAGGTGRASAGGLAAGPAGTAGAPGSHAGFAQAMHHAQPGQAQPDQDLAPGGTTAQAAQGSQPEAAALLAATPKQAEAAATTTPAAAARGAAPTPAAQVAPVIVSMASGQAGNQQLVVQLAPDELGKVEIRIDRTQDGPASVQVTAERPETLQLLQHDAPALQRTLDQAGLAPEGRTLSFHLASTETPPAPAADGSNTGWTGAGTQDGGGYRQPENQSGRQPGSQGQAFRAASGFFGAEPMTTPTAATPSAAPTRMRAGINITA